MKVYAIATNESWFDVRRVEDDRLVGLLHRPAPGVWWSHPVASVPGEGLRDLAPKQRCRTKSSAMENVAAIASTVLVGV